MNHLATSDDINVLAPPSSLQMRNCSDSPPNEHNNDSDQIRQHRPRMTSHKAIMRLHSLHSLHSMDRDCKEQEVQQRQNFAPKTNADNSIASNDASCDLLFTPPGRSSYVLGATPQSVGLDIDTTSDVPLQLPPRQVASTPPRAHHRHTIPFTARQANVSHLCIDDVFERPPRSHQASTTTTPTPITARPFVLQMKRSFATDGR